MDELDKDKPIKKFSLLDRLCIVKSIIKHRGFFKLKIKLAKDLVDRFYHTKSKRLYFIVFLSLIASLFEYLGLFLVFQFIVIVTNPQNQNSLFITDIFRKFLPDCSARNTVLCLGISIALIYIFKNIYMYFYTKINSFVMQDLSLNINLKIIKQFLYADFVLVNSIPNEDKSAILSKADNTVWRYLCQYFNLIVNFAIIIMLLIFLFIKFTLCALISFCFLGLLSLFEYRILKRKSKYQNKYFTLYFDELNKVIYRTINAIKEIRLNNKSGFFLSDVHNKFKNITKISRFESENSVFHIYFTEISIMTTFIVILFILYFTTDFNNNTIITAIGTIIAVILRISPAINRFQSALYGINSNEQFAADVIEFDKKFKNDLDLFETDEILPFNKEIRLKNVSYKYPNSAFGLNNIDLTIKKGEFIGIVGASGCYKTTLSLIIAGLIKPSGDIYIDDTLLASKDHKKWQNNISILSQDFSLIKDNIFDGLNDEIIDSLDLRELNSNPLELSFGQKQRAALAQILAYNKQLIILDEATSSLDVLLEEKINNILLNLKGKRTIISIAHRLQILKHCDRIIYMDKAKIIDIDTFKNLNDKYDEFREIINLSNFKL